MHLPPSSALHSSGQVEATLRLEKANKQAGAPVNMTYDKSVRQRTRKASTTQSLRICLVVSVLSSSSHGFDVYLLCLRFRRVTFLPAFVFRASPSSRHNAFSSSLLQSPSYFGAEKCADFVGFVFFFHFSSVDESDPTLAKKAFV